MKIKIKTLISLLLLSLFTILIVVPYINLGIGEFLDKNGSSRAQAFYKNCLFSPIKLKEKKALYLYGENILGGFHKYTIMSTCSGSGGEKNNTPEDIKKAKEVFEKILLKDLDKNYNNKYTKKAYSRLMDISIATLDIDELIHWINWGKGKNNEEIKNISKLYEGYYYYTQRDYKEAETILQGYNKGMYLDFKYYYLLGDIYSHRGNVEKAMEYFEKASNIGWIPGEYLFGGSDVSHKNIWLKDYKNKLKGDYKIRGKVSYNGKGLPFVEIYMNDEIGVF
ncbi:MAG: tetratricopeptide repeat protein, partial [Clostridium cochlearium]|uniref:tetratricopeptide repeat protein n=1 Tax=Clostridium cochlearium TaxID=1494 RepID=UPI00280BF8DF